MKRVFKLVIVMLLLIMLLSISNVNKVKGAEINFEDFNFSSTKTRIDGKIKVVVNLDWITDTQMVVSRITTEINGQSQSTSSLGNAQPVVIEREDSNGNKYNEYQYHIEYVVEHWQVGTINLIIEYFNADEGGTFVKEYCIPAGNWLTEEVSWPTAILFGLLITIGVSLGTYIIIENSKKGYMNLDNE